MTFINGQRVNAALIMKNKEENQISINVSVDFYDDLGEEIRLTHKDIENYLIQEGYKLEKCLQSSVISNLSQDSIFGTWVYQLQSEDSKKKRIKKDE